MTNRRTERQALSAYTRTTARRCHQYQLCPIGAFLQRVLQKAPNPDPLFRDALQGGDHADAVGFNTTREQIIRTLQDAFWQHKSACQAKHSSEKASAVVKRIAAQLGASDVCNLYHIPMPTLEIWLDVPGQVGLFRSTYHEARTPTLSTPTVKTKNP